MPSDTSQDLAPACRRSCDAPSPGASASKQTPLPAVIPGLVADRAVRRRAPWAAAGPNSPSHTPAPPPPRPSARRSHEALVPGGPGLRSTARKGERVSAAPAPAARVPWGLCNLCMRHRDQRARAGWTRRAQAAGLSSARPNSSANPDGSWRRMRVRRSGPARAATAAKTDPVSQRVVAREASVRSARSLTSAQPVRGWRSGI